VWRNPWPERTVNQSRACALSLRLGLHVCAIVIYGTAGAVDDVVDRAAYCYTKPFGDHVMHLYARACRRFDRIVELNIVDEIAVYAKALSDVCRDLTVHFVGRIALLIVLLPYRLAGYVIRNFGLVEVDTTTVAIPNSLKLLEVLHEETIGGYVLTIDREAVLCGISNPADAARIAVVCAPEPDVVEDEVVDVDGEAVLR
jgi:hypothetical protein